MNGITIAVLTVVVVGAWGFYLWKRAKKNQAGEDAPVEDAPAKAESKTKKTTTTKKK
jgi:hypothetical protein